MLGLPVLWAVALGAAYFATRSLDYTLPVALIVYSVLHMLYLAAYPSYLSTHLALPDKQGEETRAFWEEVSARRYRKALLWAVLAAPWAAATAALTVLGSPLRFPAAGVTVVLWIVSVAEARGIERVLRIIHAARSAVLGD